MNLVIVQARMGSTRLPGKVLKTIKNKSLMQLQYDRIKPSKLVDKIVIATTINKEDDAIENFCNLNAIEVFRGSDWDVLERFYFAAKKFNPDTIIRITSDCPMHHHTVIDFVINEYIKSGLDYFSNSNHEPDFLEDGFDVEVFSFKALETAYLNAKLLSEREHVTPYIKNSGLFNCGWKKFSDEYKFKLSVDSLEDFNVAEKIFNSFDSTTDFDMNDVINLLKTQPEILELNKNSVINSGYKKSIDNDKIL
jgi:spore coat polysaccharide biosynthesis protein SpsF (cytidylyltransferase family)